MDCDVDLQKFADGPFVIERPAGFSLLGDQATKLLAKKGFRLDFGRGALTSKHAATGLASILPSGTSVLDRQSAAIPAENATTIVAMPARASTACPQAVSGQLMQLEGLTMLGHSLCGADRQEAATFATMVAMQKQFDDAALVYFASANDPSNAMGLVDGGKHFGLKELIGRRQVVEAKIAFLGQGVDQLASLAKHAVATKGVQFASLNPDLSDLGATATSQMPEGDEVFGGKFLAKEFGSASVGPSFLNKALFNEKSMKEIQGVHPDLLSVVNRAREISPIAFEVVPDNGGMRNLAEQRRLTKAGKSRANLGRHTIGHAIDLVPTDSRGRPNFKDLKGFDTIRDAMEAAATELGVPVQWGGNWKKLVDKPHFELDRKVYPGPGEEPDVEAVMTAFR
jgi:peptidoglycan L-alanyl-D-glutamate endopeptidase CwlK